ncbi:MAG TPA: ABC transporter substrate-binding protein, partial [Polyangiaceae bacterium]
MSLLKRCRKTAALLSLLVLASCSNSDNDGAGSDKFKIGVMLPLTGSSRLDFDKGLNWAVEEINQRGVLGRKLEIAWEDIGSIPDDSNAVAAHATAAKRFLDDPEISAVIGTDYDDTTFELAPAFVEAKKLLISPSATTAEITRAFGGKQYIWRTLESDVAQSELMVLYGHDTGVMRAALLSTSDLYGETFFDWIPFYAEEIGIEMTAVERMDGGSSDCLASVERLVSEGVPDIFYFISGDYDLAYCMIESARALAPGVRIMFSDGGQVTGLFEALGDKAEGVEGVSLEAYRDPAHTEFEYESEFDVEFQARYGEIPPPYAANVFDSVALVAYALAKADGHFGEPLAQAFKQVVDSEGESAAGTVTSWNGDGIRHALDLIESGNVPDVTGATGELRFDRTLGLDLTATTYAVWQVKDGVQQWDEIQAGSRTLVYPANYFTKDDRRSKFDTVASERLMSAQGTAVTGPEVGPRQGLWAFIAALSRGWENYRHQADALNVYQRLRAQGVPDDHIVLMLADDLANDPQNQEPGVIRNVADGPNLNQN